jgi:hypothetical protein
MILNRPIYYIIYIRIVRKQHQSKATLRFPEREHARFLSQQLAAGKGSAHKNVGVGGLELWEVGFWEKTQVIIFYKREC